MKAIIVAAGPGNRARPYSNDKPKCMLKIGGKTILDRQLEILKQCGIYDIVVVKGYKADMINYPNVKYYYNRDYEKNNILESLFCAKEEIDDAFVFSYSDILYGRDILNKVLQREGDICLVVDTNWIQKYVGRNLHPETEAEKVIVEGDKIVRITKNINRISSERAYGEFIGLAKFSKLGAKILKTEYERVKQQFQGRRFHDSISIEKAYLTDMIQELIDKGCIIHNVDVKGDWWEIDTPQDLYRARKAFSSPL